MVYAFDSAGNISLVQHFDSTNTEQTCITYSYDQVNNRTVANDMNGSLTTYQYDEKDRLTTSTTTGTSPATYWNTYNANDNRLTSDEPGGVTTWTYDAANRGVTFNGPNGLGTYLYDANGNLTSIVSATSPATMQYDKENRMTLNIDNTGTYTYGYDPLGKKRTELVGGVLTSLVWDGEEYLEGRS